MGYDMARGKIIHKQNLTIPTGIRPTRFFAHNEISHTFYFQCFELPTHLLTSTVVDIKVIPKLSSPFRDFMNRTETWNHSQVLLGHRKQTGSGAFDLTQQAHSHACQDLNKHGKQGQTME